MSNLTLSLAANLAANSPFLDQIRIVLSHTTLPANIGSAARAMKTMGLADLVLINPKYPIDATSYELAKGGSDILDRVRIVPTLADALGDCALVLGASSRSRKHPRPMLTPPQMARTMGHFYAKHPNAKMALLFGQERMGLTNEELARADFHVQIRGNPTYSVLNVASSVQVLGAFLYEWAADNKALNHQKLPKKTITHTPVNAQQKAQISNVLLDLMQTLELADGNKNTQNHLYTLANNMQLTQKEFGLLAAILHRARMQIKKSKN